MKLSGILPECFDIGRLTETYAQKRRKEMSEELANSTDGVTQVSVYEDIKEMEDTVIDEMGDELPDVTHGMLRVNAQNAIMNKMAEMSKEDGQE